MKNIAILLPNLAGSGAEKVALTQAKLLSKKYNVKLFLLENIIDHDIKNIKIYPLTYIKNQYKPLKKLGDYIYKFLLLRKFKQLNFYPDVLFSHLPRADRVGKLLNMKKFFTIHISYKAEFNRFSSIRAKKKLKLYRKIYKNENLITVSNEMQKDLDELKIEYKSVQTIYNPFDFDEIREKAKEDIEYKFDYIISPNAFRIQKRYDVLLDAFKDVKHNIKLLILAKEDKKLIQMIKERNLEDKVVIAGFKKNPYPYIKNAKLTVLSSDREGLPTVLIESLILNTPVVSTNCPTGPSEILVGELSKWLVPVEDSKELAKKIDLALDTKIEIKNEYIQKFHKDEVLKKYEKIING